MFITEEITRTEIIVTKIVCDKCKKIFSKEDDWIDWQEFFSLGNLGGYGSIFGDGVDVHIDLCQHCFKELLGKYAVKGKGN